MATAQQHIAYFRFYGSLNDFLPSRHRQSEVTYTFWGRPAVKDAVEAQGVPHPEVDLIVVNGSTVSFEERISAGDQVSVYPWISAIPRPTGALRPPWPTPLQFVCDVHLGQLARYLRMMGLNTWYETDGSDPTLARVADEEKRILLTRDLGLLKRGRVQRGAYIRAQSPRKQLEEVVARFPLEGEVDPLSRCLECNLRLQEAPASAIEEQVPPRALAEYEHFVQCPSCEQVFWEGTHVERMHRLIEEVTSWDSAFAT